MAVVFKNNAKTTLASGINSSATSITVSDGSVFPSLTGSDIFFATFDDGTNNEIVKVTAISGNTLTVVRAQESTTARSFSTGDEAQLRLTAGILGLFSQTGVAITDEIEAYLDANGLTFPDNVKAQFGTGNDLQIFHDGTTSNIKDAGTGILQLTTNGAAVQIYDSVNTTTMARFNTGGAVTLNHDGTLRFQTLNTGVRTTGVLQAQNETAFSTTANSPNASIIVGNESSSVANGNYKGALGFATGDSSNQIRSAVVAKQTHTSANRQGLAFLVHPDTVAGTLNEAFVINHDSTATFAAGVDVTGISAADNLHINSTSGQLKISRVGSSNNGIYWDRLGTQDAAIQVASNEQLNIDNNFGNPINLRIGADGSETTYLSASTSGIDVTGNIVVSGTVDGRDIATDGTKLDGIEASATADQTASEIRTLVESATDSNVFTDADHTKLNAIEASATADQTQSEINALGITATGLSGSPNITVGTISSGAITSTGQVKAQSLFIDSGGYTPQDAEGQEFKYYLVSQGTDQNYKKVADVTISTGLYKALALRVVLESQLGNFGNTAAVDKTEYVCLFYRSGGVQDDLDTAEISGQDPTSHNLRIVKTATGVYELQVRQNTNYRDAILKLEVLSTNGGSISIQDGNVNGSTSGTVVTPSSSDTKATYSFNKVDTPFLNIQSNIKVNSTQILDSSRNLSNIGTIGSGAITSTGTSTFGTVTSASYKVGASTVIDNSRNLLNIGTISSGAITSTGASSFGSISGTLASTVTATTQAASDNSTKVSTTAYVTTAIANLVDGAPSTLNTLNEIAAALNDDAALNTTLTNSIAAKLPLAGGTMTGALNMGSQNITNAGTISSGTIDAGNVQITSTGSIEIFRANGAFIDFKDSSSDDFDSRIMGGNNLVFSAGGAGSTVTALTLSSGGATFGGTISSGAITSSSALTGTRLNITNSAAPYIVFTEGSDQVHMGVDGGSFWVRQNGLGGGNEISIQSDGTFNVSHNATFAGTISSGDVQIGGTVSGTHTLKVYHTDNYEAAKFRTNQAGSLARFTDTTASVEFGVQSGIPVIRTGNTARFSISGADVRVNSGALQMGTTTVIDSSRNLTNIGTISSGAITTSGLLTVGSGAGAIKINESFITARSSDNVNDINLIANINVFDADDVVIGSTSGQRFNDNIVFRTNGSQALRLDSSQNATFAGAITTGDDIILPNDKDVIFRNGSGSDDGTKITRASGNALRIKYTGNSAIFDALADNDWRIQNSAGDIIFSVSPNSTAASSSVDVRSGKFRMGTTTVIDSSRNLTNIGTISSGTINAGNVELTSSGSIEIIRNGDAFIDFKSSSSEDFDCRIQQISDGIQFITGGNAGTATALTLNSSQNATFGGVVGIGGTSTNSSYGIWLQNNKWYATQYSSSHDVVRMNANTTGGLDIYNQTDSAFAVIRTGGVNIGSTQVIDGSRNLINIGTISSGDITVGVQDTTNGTITLSGGGAGNQEGGEIRLQTSADNDGTYDHYRLDVFNDDFRIGRAGATDLYIFQDGLVKAENNFQAGGTGSFGNLVNALAYQVSGTEVISSGRNLTNIAGISTASGSSMGHGFVSGSRGFNFESGNETTGTIRFDANTMRFWSGGAGGGSERIRINDAATDGGDINFYGSIDIESGGLKTAGTTVIDSATRVYTSSVQHSGKISFLNGSNGSTGSGAQGIRVNTLYAGTSYASDGAASGMVDTLNGYRVQGTQRIDSSGNFFASDSINIGDDAVIDDMNVANTIRVKGQQASNQGYIVFADNNTAKLGCNNSSTLTYGNDFQATGRLIATGHVIAGSGSGGVALTHNDGYGNANVTFNHVSGVPEQNGASARIVVNTDSAAAAQMEFEVSSAAVTSGSAVNLPVGLKVGHNYVEIPNTLRHQGDTNTYFQFNAADSARIVVGGTVRFLVNSSGVHVNNSTLDLNAGNLLDAGTIASKNITVTASADTAVGFTIKRSSSSGRSQIVLANESAAELWRFGLTGGGSDDFAFYDGGANVLVLDRGTNDATFAGNVTAYSDERLKDNIETLDGKKALQMRGVSFTKQGKAGSGVIAQELEKIAPELVLTANDEQGTKSVAYGNLVGYLIEAIKDQQKEIEYMKSEIKTLKEANNGNK